jgi:hypothetical protein
MLEDLTQAASAPPPAPKGFSPGVVYSGRTPSEITTPWLTEQLETPEDWADAVAQMGVPLPAGMTLELVEAKFNSAAWHRDHGNVGEKNSAYTAPMWLYRFKVVPEASVSHKLDLEAMLKEARKAARGATKAPTTGGGTQVINLADFQVGKTDELGGTPELLERSEKALAEILKMVRRRRPAEILLVDLGDSTEGFESSPNAERTNDLQQTEQIRVWRRIFWRWFDSLARLGIPMKTVSVPSNHCAVRRGKQYVGPADDDWGLEVLAQIADMAGVNPEVYGHVEFIVPRKHERHVAITAADGQVLLFAHGDDANSADRLIPWIKAQGRREIGQADIVNVGHWHHLRIMTFGDRQWLIINPTMDGGSSWFTPQSGERSRPGVLTYMVGPEGWYDLHVAWA